MQPAQNEANPFHLVIWLDHRLARLFQLTRQEFHESVLHCPENGGGHGNIHHHSGTTGAGHNDMSAPFMEKIAAAIGDAAEIFLVGPGEAKMAFKSHLERHHPRLAVRILGIEAMDKASAGEIAAAGRKYFSSADRMKQPVP